MENISSVFLLLQILPFPGMKLGIPEGLKCSHIPAPPSSSAQTTLSTWILLMTKYVLCLRTDASN